MKKIYIMISILFLMISVSCYFGLAVNYTESLPKGLYIESSKPLTHNNIVKFCLPTEISEEVKARLYLGEGLCENGRTGLLKVVLGVEGDTVTIENDIVYVKRQDKQFSTALRRKEFDSLGNYTISILKEGVIPKGKLFVYTSHNGSFDSRYYGLIDKEIVIPMIELITFN